MIIKSGLFFTTLMLVIALSKAQSKEELLIRNVLLTQQTAWNKGDINTFMQGYWNNDSLMFIGKSGITYGWKKTLENYQKGYPDTAAMGKLQFEFIEIKRLSPEYYFVAGKWFLTRTIGNINGSFTLLFKKIHKRWLIVKDHSS